MGAETLAAALEREHHEIDGGIESFAAGLASGEGGTAPVVRAMESLRRHIFLEEQLLFPPLREAGMMAPVLVMLREHGEIWQTLEQLDTALAENARGSAVPPLLTELAAQLERHNTKEEPILYPQADLVLSAAATAELREFLASGRMPDGWVCQRAQT